MDAATAEAVERRVLGHGLALTAVPGTAMGMDLALGPTEGGRDLVRVAGAGALAQDLAVTLLTPLGGNPLNVFFGFDGLRVLVEGVPPSLVPELLRLAVLRAVSADGRVREVADVTLTRVNPQERRWRVDVTVRTVLREALALTLGEVRSDG